eukprot:2664315-Pyramimonas_sp.AAC.1
MRCQVVVPPAHCAHPSATSPRQEWVLWMDPDDEAEEAMLVPKGVDLDDPACEIETHFAQNFLSFRHYGSGDEFKDVLQASDGTRIPRKDIKQAHTMATFTLIEEAPGREALQANGAVFEHDWAGHVFIDF